MGTRVRARGRHTPRTYYAMRRKLARGLLRQLRNDSYAQSQSEWPATPGLGRLVGPAVEDRLVSDAPESGHDVSPLQSPNRRHVSSREWK